jgi:hypothetical protein
MSGHGMGIGRFCENTTTDGRGLGRALHLIDRPSRASARDPLSSGRQQ